MDRDAFNSKLLGKVRELNEKKDKEKIKEKEKESMTKPQKMQALIMKFWKEIVIVILGISASITLYYTLVILWPVLIFLPFFLFGIFDIKQLPKNILILCLIILFAFLAMFLRKYQGQKHDTSSEKIGVFL